MRRRIWFNLVIRYMELLSYETPPVKMARKFVTWSFLEDDGCNPFGLLRILVDMQG